MDSGGGRPAAVAVWQRGRELSPGEPCESGAGSGSREGSTGRVDPARSSAVAAPPAHPFVNWASVGREPGRGEAGRFGSSTGSLHRSQGEESARATDDGAWGWKRRSRRTEGRPGRWGRARVGFSSPPSRPRDPHRQRWVAAVRLRGGDHHPEMVACRLDDWCEQRDSKGQAGTETRSVGCRRSRPSTADSTFWTDPSSPPDGWALRCRGAPRGRRAGPAPPGKRVAAAAKVANPRWSDCGTASLPGGSLDDGLALRSFCGRPGRLGSASGAALGTNPATRGCEPPPPGQKPRGGAARSGG